MKHEEFEIGKTFFASGGFQWLCTDKGTRTITAIMLDPDKDPSWFKGPPYAVAEVVFDEYDFPACSYNMDYMIIERIDKNKQSFHPGFSSEDVFEMLDQESEIDQHYQNLLKHDRVNLEGHILHPYSVIYNEEVLTVKLFELFSKQYLDMNANDFILLPIRTEEAMQKRSNYF